MEQDDFDEMMQEIVPQLIDQHVEEQQPEHQSSSPMGFSTKREASQEAERRSQSKTNPRKTFFIGSRFVVVNKSDEDGERVKSRWCLQGHLDPDFREKLSSGMCHAPTLHQLSRALLLQIFVSNRWMLQLGDIKGAWKTFACELE